MKILETGTAGRYKWKYKCNYWTTDKYFSIKYVSL